MTKGAIFLLFLLAGILAPSGLKAEESPPWALTVYHGQASFTKFVDLLRFNADFQPYYLTTVTLGREFTRWGKHLAWEWESQVTKHSGGQDHLEFGLILVMRWHRFPWDDFVDTTVALGSGPSYALKKPPVEAALHDNVSKLLNFLTIEFTFSPPRSNRWSAMTRIHHRSGAGGTIHGVSGGSNFVVAGLRRYF